MILEPMPKPKSIVIIGASENTKSIGDVTFDLLKRVGPAKIYPANPNNETVQGLMAFRYTETVR